MEEHRKQAGARLAALRDSRGLSQEELAHLAGISVKTISRFENGRHDGSRSTVRSLAKALKVNEHEIVGPPPAPLGLGDSQLDRIEAKLDELLTQLAASQLPAGFDAAAFQAGAQQAPSAEEPPRRTGSQQAS